MAVVRTSLKPRVTSKDRKGFITRQKQARTTAKASSKDSGTWTPPRSYDRKAILAVSRKVLGQSDISLKQTEDVFRIEALGLDWDMGVMVYEPRDPSKVAVGADGKKIGIFLLHGGDADYKAMEPIARIYAGKFGHKAVSMTFPGRLYLDDPSRDWPGDTVRPDGTVRTPIWKEGEHITADQYDVIRDTSLRLRYGTRVVARAKPGTTFYNRMAAWPMAFERGMQEAMRRHFPESEYSIFGTGHSTGGPIIFMISQRVPNFAGVIAAEHSPFGYIQEKQHDWSGALGKVAGHKRASTKPAPRTDLFNELYIRTWRDCARYAGPEALGREGPMALMRLPSLMEEVHDWWDQEKSRPQFKAEYVITNNILNSLAEAAMVSAARLGFSPEETAKLVEHYQGYPRPLSGPGAKPVPPVLFAITKDSRDHSPEVYKEVILPMFQTIEPTPKVRLTQFGASTHFYMRPEDDLPAGVAPTLAKHFHEAIIGGYFLR
jgi:hypothetical protein